MPPGGCSGGSCPTPGLPIPSPQPVHSPVVNNLLGAGGTGFCTPASGPGDPLIRLTYWSNSFQAGPTGYGWSMSLSRHIELGNGSIQNVQLFTDDGGVYCFTNLGGPTGFYVNSSSAPSSLEKTADGWIEYPNFGGCELHYDSDGKLVKICDTDESTCWTINYASPMNSIVSPFGTRTSFTYDANGHLSRIIDSAGRETALNFDVNGNLLEYTTPELCNTVMEYTGHLLTKYTDPEGNAHNYDYDTAGRVQSYTDPTGAKTTYSYQQGPGRLGQGKCRAGSVALVAAVGRRGQCFLCTSYRVFEVLASPKCRPLCDVRARG